MNYEARIAQLQAKGILDEQGAQKLKETLDAQTPEERPRRRFSLETAGVLLLLLLFAYFAWRIGVAPDNTSRVEEVAQTLNLPREGIGAFGSFGLSVLLALSGAFVLLYGSAHHFYNRAWSCQRDLRAYGAMIADLEERREGLKASLYRLTENEEPTKPLLLNPPTEKTRAMEILHQLQEELGRLQALHHACQARCLGYSRHFPYNLSRVAGTLPTCR